MQNVLTGTLPMRGDLRIVVRRVDTGAVHWRYQIRNTITTVGLKSVVSLLAQVTSLTDPKDYQVKYLRVGTGTTPPTRADTNLNAVVTAIGDTHPYTLDLLDANKTLTVVNPFELKLTASIPAGVLNGVTLTEAGLFTRGNALVIQPPGQYLGYWPELFARQIHPAILKDPAFVVDYDWRIAFTA